MKNQFDGKVTLITGASSGIGRSTALAFGQQGARVVVADVATEGGQETVRAIEEQGGMAEFVKVDVTEADEVKAAVQETVDRFGRLDIAVNNAGIGSRWTKVGDYTLDDWHKVIAVNLNGVFYCLRYEIGQMVRQGAGVIVNVSSVAGLRGLAKSSAYSASKHGVIGLTKSAALEYARQNIRINAVCPVFTRTPLFEELFAVNPSYEDRLKRNIPMGRYGTPEDIARAIVWLCSDEAEFVTGQALSLDGGLTAG